MAVEDEGGSGVMRLAVTLSLPRQPASVTRVRSTLDTLLNVTDVTAECRGHLAVMITEACANAVVHAQGGSTFDVTITMDDDVCVLEVGNRGTEPTGAGIAAELPDPLTVGSRGLPLIAALADTAAFVPAPPGQVLLRIMKRLAVSPVPADR